MGSGKIAAQPPQQGYRDDPQDDRAETSSMASAVLLDHIEAYPEDELPAYADFFLNSQVLDLTILSLPPELPFSNSDMTRGEIRTRFPTYSTNPKILYDMIKEQARYAPGYYVELHGTHKETSRRGNKETKTTVNDFFVRLNLTHLLYPDPGQNRAGKVELLPDNTRGYRGGIIPSLKPTLGAGDSEEQSDELRAWCEHYVQNPASIKYFTLERKVTNHDTKKLESLLRSAIYETNYRGHLQINFVKDHKRLVVYSPSKLNDWRTTTWIRWVFYLTFLWIFSWPILFFFTHKYEVMKVIFPYADIPRDDGGNRKCTVMSEVEWFHRWESAIKRAALARMMCEERTLDDDYRIATANADARGMQPREQPRTGNAIADGALSILGEGFRIAESWNASRGWGADC
ncbi:hypothetical protein B0O99DRAFT_689678 [Bisporella sp. PMI_857]|nr:hypothetical protein B0O99DRAFT_689678 [Bisporella sp. PMI_857]